jgi:SAM-dependent methyltransferase
MLIVRFDYSQRVGWKPVPGVLPLIALQQTDCQGPLSRFSGWDRLRLRSFYSRHLLPKVEEHTEALMPKYRDGMRAVASGLVNGAAPPATLRVLDVGGGVGGLGIALHERLGDALRYTLLDREGIDRRIWYGLRGEGAKYNSLGVATRFCAANGVDIETIDIDERSFPEGPFDLIVSTISWGFHYPVATYADAAVAALAPGGRIVLDVRTTATSDAEIAAAFPGWQQKTLLVSEKYRRVELRRG